MNTRFGQDYEVEVQARFQAGFFLRSFVDIMKLNPLGPSGWFDESSDEAYMPVYKVIQTFLACAQTD